jgi:DNA topoisomerase-1
MALAQRLYEGVDIGEEGITGLITYMRTDSVRISDEAIKDARQFIGVNFGKPYLPKSPHVFKNRKTAQDAHEAIRPSYVDLTPEKLKPYLEKDLLALYELIWKRFIASQMALERVKTKAVDVEGGGYTFVARGSEIVFDGFTRIYEEDKEDEESSTFLPDMKEGEKTLLQETILNQRFTNPPPRYTEASLIKTLETKGIGRPSTYATIVSTVQDRTYVKKDKGKLLPTPLGKTVNKLLKEFFPLIVDVDFTAKMEDRLDLIEDGKKSWVKSLEKFYEVFQEALSTAQQDMKSLKREERETDIICEQCGRRMLLRWGKNGEYLVCSWKPAEVEVLFDEPKNKKAETARKLTLAEDFGLDVENIAAEVAKTFGLREPKGALVSHLVGGGAADKAGIKRGDLIISFNGKPIKDVNSLAKLVSSAKVGKKVKVGLIEEGRPACKNKKNAKVDSDGQIKVIEAEVKGVCPKCGGNLVEKRGRYGRFLACSNYPECKYTEPYNLGFLCPVEDCSGKLVEKLSKKRTKFVSCSRYPDCKFATNAEPVEGPCPACGAPTLFSLRRKTRCLRKDCGWTLK